MSELTVAAGSDIANQEVTTSLESTTANETTSTNDAKVDKVAKMESKSHRHKSHSLKHPKRAKDATKHTTKHTTKDIHPKEDINKKESKHKRKHHSSNLLHKKVGENKRPHRFRSGTVALRQIRHLQKSTNNQIPRQAFKRLVRQIILEENPAIRLKRKALEALHVMTENYIVGVFNNAQRFAIHRNRQGVRQMDYDLALHFRRESELAGAF